jgi:hypothetical protein
MPQPGVLRLHLLHQHAGHGAPRPATAHAPVDDPRLAYRRVTGPGCMVFAKHPPRRVGTGMPERSGHNYVPAGIRRPAAISRAA